MTGRKWAGRLVAAMALLTGCDSQNVLDPAATQQGTVVASLALADALDRVVPAISDGDVRTAIHESLVPLQQHLAAGDIVHARATLWHVTRILDDNRAHPNPAVLAELGAVRLAIWVVHDFLKVPFEG